MTNMLHWVGNSEISGQKIYSTLNTLLRHKQNIVFFTGIKNYFWLMMDIGQERTRYVAKNGIPHNNNNKNDEEPNEIIKNKKLNHDYRVAGSRFCFHTNSDSNNVIDLSMAGWLSDGWSLKTKELSETSQNHSTIKIIGIKCLTITLKSR